MSTHRTYTGIDADTQRIALVTVSGQRVLRCVTVQRTLRKQHIAPDYDVRLFDELRALKQMNSIVYLEMPFLAHGNADGLARSSVVMYAGLSRVCGEVQMAGRWVGLHIHGVLARYWQQDVLGKGMVRDELKRASVAMAAEPMAWLGREITHHEADAWGVAEWARRHHGKRVASRGTPQMELLG